MIATVLTWAWVVGCLLVGTWAIAACWRNADEAERELVRRLSVGSVQSRSRAKRALVHVESFRRRSAVGVAATTACVTLLPILAAHLLL